jgi:hypothetical protein
MLAADDSSQITTVDSDLVSDTGKYVIIKGCHAASLATKP